MVRNKQALLTIEEEHLLSNTEGVGAQEVAALQPRLKQIHERVVTGSKQGLQGEFACLTLGESMQPDLAQIESYAHELKRFKEVLVIGIGGSSLGAKAVYRALIEDDVHHLVSPHLHFIENVDPGHLGGLLTALAPQDTAVIVISKSGGTLETIAQFLIVRDWLTHALGEKEAHGRQYIVTDARQGWLRGLAQREDLPSLAIPERVGGRYSALTSVGLLPLAVAGVDMAALLHGAADNAARCDSGSHETNPALRLAAFYYLLHTTKKRNISIMMPYTNALYEWSHWYRQLWAESLGKPVKDGYAGTLPVTALGTVDQHSQLQFYLSSARDKFFTFLTLDRWPHQLPVPISEHAKDFPYLKDRSLDQVMAAEFNATRIVLSEAGHPSITVRLPYLDAYALGQWIDLFQRVTIYVGLLYGVNPLDQPAVERGKKLVIESLSGHS